MRRQSCIPQSRTKLPCNVSKTLSNKLLQLTTISDWHQRPHYFSSDIKTTSRSGDQSVGVEKVKLYWWREIRRTGLPIIHRRFSLDECRWQPRKLFRGRWTIAGGYLAFAAESDHGDCRRLPQTIHVLDQVGFLALWIQTVQIEVSACVASAASKGVISSHICGE